MTRETEIETETRRQQAITRNSMDTKQTPTQNTNTKHKTRERGVCVRPSHSPEVMWPNLSVSLAEGRGSISTKNKVQLQQVKSAINERRAGRTEAPDINKRCRGFCCRIRTGLQFCIQPCYPACLGCAGRGRQPARSPLVDCFAYLERHQSSLTEVFSRFYPQVLNASKSFC